MGNIRRRNEFITMLRGLRCHKVSLCCISMSNRCGHNNLLILLGRHVLIQSEVFSLISLVVILAAVMITCYQQISRARIMRGILVNVRATVRAKIKSLLVSQTHSEYYLKQFISPSDLWLNSQAFSRQARSKSLSSYRPLVR